MNESFFLTFLFFCKTFKKAFTKKLCLSHHGCVVKENWQSALLSIFLKIYIYCVCVKRKILCNYLCSSSCHDSASLIRNIGEFGTKNYFADYWTANTFQLFVPIKRNFFGSIFFLEQLAAKANSLEDSW